MGKQRPTDNGLDPEIQAFVDGMSARWREHPPLKGATPAQARQIAERVRHPLTLGGPVMRKTSELRVPGRHGETRIRVHEPAGDGPKPVLVYLHGGGWQFFSLDTHDRLMREYAARAGVVVAGVDYALSPEHRFPVAIRQAVEVLRWLRANAASVGADPGRIAVGGDSAGAAMSVGAALVMRDAGEPDAIKALLLNYGCFDARCTGESFRRYGQGGYLWDPGEMAAFWKAYLGDTPPTDPLACPIHADLVGLPPALSVIAACDVLYDEGLAMAEKLRRSGVRSSVAIYAGTTHSFLEAVSMARVAGRAFDDASRWLSDTLAPARARVAAAPD